MPIGMPGWPVDRILYRGNSLDLAVYSRAELKGSDHRPGKHDLFISVFKLQFSFGVVFAIFRANVRIIDTAKRLALSQILLDNVISTGPGEKLDEKLASLRISLDEEQDCSFPFQSSLN